MPPAAFRPHFFGACPKKRCRAAKEKRFFYLGGSTIRVSATASVVFTHLRPTLGGGWWLSGRGCVCAVTLGGGRWPVLRFDPISLVLAQRNGVEPPKKSAFLPRWLHHPRERYCLGCRYSSSPDLGRGLVFVGGLYGCAVFLGRSLFPLLPVPPHFFALAQRNGVEPQRNALLGAATGAVRSHPPLPRTRSPNITADCVKLT